MSFGHKSAGAAAKGAPTARPATRAVGGSALGSPETTLIVAGLGGVAALLAVGFFLVLPMLKSDGKQAEVAARQAWRLQMNQICPAPTVNEALLPASKGGAMSSAARLQYADRVHDLGKLGNHISCAMQYRQERLCSAVARSEFLEHVKSYFSLRSDLQAKLATAAGTSSANIEKQIALIVAAAQSKQSNVRLSDQERPVVEQMLAVGRDDSSIMRGLGALVEDGLVPPAELTRATGALPPAFAPLSKAQAARNSCS